MDKQKLKLSHDQSFAAWLDEPMTRLGMSLIPGGTHQDALKMLLRSAFDAGVGTGSAETAIAFFKTVMELDKKPPPPDENARTGSK